MATDGMHQIGEVADLTGLSLRTIRHYEEVDLVPPSGRTAGGFRLYTDADVDRLQVVKHLKPLRFTLDEMRTIADALEGRGDAEDRRTHLATYVDEAEGRCGRLREQLAAAEALVATMRRAADR
jgi:MerR family transcriptional regulator, copper efflux regulator